MIKLFISTPMSAVSEEKYATFRKQVLALIAFLKKMLKTVDIHYSGDVITTHDQFDDSINSYKRDIEALERCTMFALIYPEKSPTSALVELGYALKMGVPVMILTSDRKILPYMIRELDKSISQALIIEYGNDEILNYVENNRNKISDFFAQNY